MAESPKPSAAMLHGDPGWLRSRISPVVGLASSQAKRKAPYWRLSRMASVVSTVAAEAIGAAQASATRTTRSGCAMRWIMGAISPISVCESVAQAHADPMDVPQSSVGRPGVVDAVLEGLQALVNSGAERQTFLRVLIEEGLVSGAQRDQIAERRLDA